MAVLTITAAEYASRHQRAQDDQQMKRRAQVAAMKSIKGEAVEGKFKDAKAFNMQYADYYDSGVQIDGPHILGTIV